MNVSLTLGALETKRRCGECSLCCRLLPMTAKSNTEGRKAMLAMVGAGLMSLGEMSNVTPDFEKEAGERCKHQRLGGCAIYERRPFGCRYWNCRWLANDDTGELRRPDRSHYVIDCMPDFVRQEVDGVETKIPVLQVWVDPRFRDAHKDPALRDYLMRRAHEGYAALIRYDSYDGFLLVAPPMTNDGTWWELESNNRPENEHKAAEILATLAELTDER